jgi:hypothetical protein
MLTTALATMQLPFSRQALSGKIDMMVPIGVAEELAAIQWDRSMWLRKGDDNFERR